MWLRDAIPASSASKSSAQETVTTWGAAEGCVRQKQSTPVWEVPSVQFGTPARPLRHASRTEEMPRAVRPNVPYMFRERKMRRKTIWFIPKSFGCISTLIRVGKTEVLVKHGFSLRTPRVTQLCRCANTLSEEAGRATNASGIAESGLKNSTNCNGEALRTLPLSGYRRVSERRNRK